MVSGISKIRHRLAIPLSLRAGETARQIAPFPLAASDTTRLVSKGSSPLSTHSTEAKKAF